MEVDNLINCSPTNIKKGRRSSLMRVGHGTLKFSSAPRFPDMPGSVIMNSMPENGISVGEILGLLHAGANALFFGPQGVEESGDNIQFLEFHFLGNDSPNFLGKGAVEK